MKRSGKQSLKKNTYTGFSLSKFKSWKQKQKVPGTKNV